MNEPVTNTFKSGFVSIVGRPNVGKSTLLNALIREKVITPGRTVVWVYAPGYVDGERLSTDRVADTVGMKIEKSTVNLPPQLLLREGSITPDWATTSDGKARRLSSATI